MENEEVDYSDVGFDRIYQSKIDNSIIGNLSKYVKYESPALQLYDLYGELDQMIFDYPDVTTKTIGIYAWIVSQAKISSRIDCRVVERINIGFFINMLGTRKTKYNSKVIEESIEWLQRHKFIDIKDSLNYKSEIFYNIYVPKMEDHYCKIYTYSSNKIINEANGLSALTKLGVYAAIRSRIFDERKRVEKGGKIFNSGTIMTIESAHCSEKVYFESVEWLCEHEIFAYFIGTKRPDQDGHKGRKKRYMSEMKDHVRLTGDMIGKLLHGDLMWVSKDVYQNSKSKHVDTELDKAEGE